VISFGAENASSQILFQVHRVSETAREPEWYMDKIDRPYTVFWYITSGEKNIIVDDVHYTVKQGDLVVFPAHVSFVVLKNEINTCMCHFDFTIETKLGFFDLLKLYKFPVVTTGVDPASFSSLLKLWRNLKCLWNPENEQKFTSDNVNAYQMNKTVELLHFHSLTIAWLVELFIVLRPDSIVTSLTSDPRIQNVMVYIRDHLSEKLSVKKMADIVYLSESHLNLLFRQNVKMSPMEYVRQVRLQKARELLISTNLRLKDISESIGFEEQSQLSRAFRQEVGIGPMEYRRNSKLL